MKKILTYPWYVIFAALVVMVGFFIRLALIIQAKYPVGLDGGAYRYYFNMYQSQFPAVRIGEMGELIERTYPPMLGWMGGFFGMLGVTSDHLIMYAPFIFTLVIAVSVYFFLRVFSRQQALIGAVLVLFSMPIFMLEWSGFLKQLLATPLMLIVFTLVIKKRYLSMSFLYLIVLMMHRPTGLVCTMVLVGLLLFGSRYIQREKLIYAMVWPVILAVILYMPVIEVIILGFIDRLDVGNLLFREKGGTFFTRLEFLSHQIPLICAFFVGLIVWLKSSKICPAKHNPSEYIGRWIIILIFIISFLWFILGASFHNRMQPFLDVSAILIFCVFLLPYFLRFRPGSIFVTCVIVMQVILTTSYVYKHRESSIIDEEIAIIKDLDTLLSPESYIFASDPHYVTWVMGYSQFWDHTLGYTLRDGLDWSSTQWTKWVTTDGYGKCEMLYDVYHSGFQPLYVIHGESSFRPINTDGAYCFRQVDMGSSLQLYEVSYEF